MRKTEKEITLSDDILMWDFYIGTGVTDAVRLIAKDTWGVLTRKDSELARKEVICPEDLWDKPLIYSQQEDKGGQIIQWPRKKHSFKHCNNLQPHIQCILDG